MQSQLNEYEDKLNRTKTYNEVNHSSIVSNSKLEMPTFIPADVADDKQIQVMFHQIKQQYGQVNVVLNCAAIGIALRTYDMKKVRMNINEYFFSFLILFYHSAFNA